MEDIKAKDFWEKPEGKTGMLFAVLLISGGAILFFHFLPLMLLLAQNTLYLILMLSAIGATGYVLLDPNFRNLAGFMYRVAMKKATGVFIEMDPIAIIEVYIDDIKANREKMNTQLGNLNGQVKSLDKVINDNMNGIDNQLSIAKQAQKVGLKGQVTLKARLAQKLKDSNTTLSELKIKLELLYRVLSKMYENSGYLLEDIEFDVDVKKRERKAIQTGYSAMKSAMKIINGDKDKKMMFEEAMEIMADDIGMKVGEMERFMELSANFMDSIDLQNGIIEENGLKMLEQWEKDGDSLLLGNDKSILVAQANNIHDVLDVDNLSISGGRKKENQYAQLFNFDK